MRSATEVRSTRGKGRGVFATRRIRYGALIEEAPVIVIPAAQWRLLARTVLEHYAFEWGEGAAIALGTVSIYNHAVDPSAHLVPDRRSRTIRVVALRPVRAGEEITIDYAAGDRDRVLWFEPRR